VLDVFFVLDAFFLPDAFLLVVFLVPDVFFLLDAFFLPVRHSVMVERTIAPDCPPRPK
jgi:hypothetical protein